MKKETILSVVLAASMVFSGCASSSSETVTTVTPTATAPSSVLVAETTNVETESVFTSRDMDASYSEADSIAMVLKGDTISCDSNSVDISGTTATIREEGTYLLSGTLEDGTIVVDADQSSKIQLVLNDVSIKSETSAPIYIRQVDKVFLTLAPGSENSLSNGGSFTPDADTNIDAVIFSKDDLTFNGSGTLTITSPGGHGIVSKDSLRVTGGTYIIDAESHGLSGVDEVSIADGTFDITAGKDGIHAEKDADGGTVYLENGTYHITASGDGISASGDCRIADGDYSITAGGGSENGQQHTSNQGFGRGQKAINRGMDTMPADRQMPDGQNSPQHIAGGKGGMGGGKSFDAMNQKPVNRQEESAPAEEADTVSAKGIKAGSLTIEGGRYTIDTADDGLHTNGNAALLGGTLEITSGDDGIHADNTVTVVSGSVNITRSYEGIEGQHVVISGGEISLIATDDGLNAAGGTDGSGFGKSHDTFSLSGNTPSILISGGTISITASGDGIDANGTLEITGGTVTVSGPTYGDTSVLDFDITGTISGGSFIGTGSSSMAQTFSNSTQGVISVNVGSQSAGTEITLTDNNGTVILSHSPALDYEIVILSTPSIQSGKSYSLCVGNSTQNFTAK